MFVVVFFCFFFALKFAGLVKNHICAFVFEFVLEKKENPECLQRKKIRKQVQAGLNKITVGLVERLPGNVQCAFFDRLLTSLTNDKGSG